MSKELDLLKEIMCYIASGVISITNIDLGDAAETVNEIRQLLLQPEQKPFAWAWEQLEFDSYTEEYGEDFVLILSEDKPNTSEEGIENIQPLYTVPPQPEPLSDEWIKNNIHFAHQDVSFTELVRAIEKAHGIGE